MICNAVIKYIDLATGVVTEEAFCDPYIFIGPDGELWNWNGKEWRERRMTYGGKPIGNMLLGVRNTREPPNAQYD